MLKADGIYKYGTAFLPRWDAEIPVAWEASNPKSEWFPVRRICLVLGIESQDQIDKMRADSRFDGALREVPMRIPPVGWRSPICVHRDKLPLWFMGIDPARCALKAQGELQDFQAELLAEGERILFHPGQRPRKESPAKVTHTAWSETRFTCEHGTEYSILVENGVPILRRLSDGE